MTFPLPTFLPPNPPAAIAKYGKGQATDDLATAVSMLIERNIMARLVGKGQGG